ncbi:MAG: HupE/UreJ family protein [Deltaproteobacteria bacterium]|nr:HupE/UreJ family protein [Deltaproteobacteria bacterium]
MSRWLRRCVAMAAACLATAAAAHPLAPALLDLRELGDGRIAVTWKTSRYRATGSEVAPRLPPDCAPLSAPQTSGDAESLTSTWQVRCPSGLVGARVGVSGLAGAGIDALVRVALADGRVVRGVVRGATPELVVPERQIPGAIARAYLAIGAAHILSGLDHLVLIAALLLLARARRQLIATVVAFTLGHSLTLTLAALDVVRLPSRAVEWLIAASLFALAVVLARPLEAAPSRLARRPWRLALLVGLLQGLGFAGALRDIGLPSGDVPLALLSFNLGIELGQAVVIAVVLGGAAALSRLPLRWPAWAPLAPVYVIGTLAAYWCLERTAALMR